MNMGKRYDPSFSILVNSNCIHTHKMSLKSLFSFLSCDFAFYN